MALSSLSCADPTGQNLSEIDVPQIALLAETITEGPVNAIQAIGQNDCYNFRKLIWANARKDVSCAWAAFGILVKWLSTGIYQNDQTEATHIDAFLLSEKLQSPRFGNSEMRRILKQIPATKDDGTLADTLRRLCDETIQNSLQKKLHFDAAIWWFPPDILLNGTRNHDILRGMAA